MCSVRAVQQNNYHCDYDQSECVSSKGVGCRFEKLLKTNFIINTFQDFRSHLQKNYILEQVFTERLFFVEHISATVFHKIVFITPLLFSLINRFHISSTMDNSNFSATLLMSCSTMVLHASVHVGY